MMSLDFDGIAIGGLSVGEPKSIKTKVLQSLADKLPSTLPHYVMGVGTPEELVEGVRYGIDMFDCVIPTRNARNGFIYTSNGILKIEIANIKILPYQLTKIAIAIPVVIFLGDIYII